MQHATGPNFSAAREKAVVKASSDDMSQVREHKLEALIEEGGARRSKLVTFAPAERRASTVLDPMKPGP